MHITLHFAIPNLSQRTNKLVGLKNWQPGLWLMFFSLFWKLEFLSYRKRGFDYIADPENLYTAISDNLAKNLYRSLMKVGDKT